MSIKKSKIKLMKAAFLRLVNELGDEMGELRDACDKLSKLQELYGKFNSEFTVLGNYEELEAIEALKVITSGLTRFFRVYETQKFNRDDVIPILAIMGVFPFKFVNKPHLFEFDGYSGIKLLEQIYDSFGHELVQNEVTQNLNKTESGDQVHSSINKDVAVQQVQSIDDDCAKQIIDLLIKKKNLTRQQAVLFAIEHELI